MTGAQGKDKLVNMRIGFNRTEGERREVWIIKMTKLLKEAFQKAGELPEDLQDELAQEVLERIYARQRERGHIPISAKIRT